MIYAIDDSHGNQVTIGLAEHDVWRTARRIATERGETVSVYEAGNSESECVEVRPGVAYRIVASYERDGQVLDCTSAEVIGDAYGKRYAESEDADREAERLTEEVGEYDLDPSTTYSVEEV